MRLWRIKCRLFIFKFSNYKLYFWPHTFFFVNDNFLFFTTILANIGLINKVLLSIFSFLFFSSNSSSFLFLYFSCFVANSLSTIFLLMMIFLCSSLHVNLASCWKFLAVNSSNGPFFGNTFFSSSRLCLIHVAMSGVPILLI